MDLPMCNFRSIPWYCRYVVIGHNSNFGKDLIFTIVMTQTHFKTRSTRLPTEMMTLRRLSWSQIYVFIRKRVISLEKNRIPTKKTYLWTLSSRFSDKCYLMSIMIKSTFWEMCCFDKIRFTTRGMTDTLL